ncbi:MAG: hypothetical protein V4499_04380 [Pseudomonadota bacterium]
MIAQQAHQAAIRRRLIVNFMPLRLRREDAIPKRAEESSVAAIAQAVGALAAHAGEGGSIDDAPCRRQRVEEAQLALGGPAVASDSSALA